jgi:hypothetical protein
MQTIVGAPDYISFSETSLLGSLRSSEYRPNVLVVCHDARVDSVVGQLQDHCVSPGHICHVPGKLDFPDIERGTLIVHDVAALTIDQQIALGDWIERRRVRVQVLSVTRAPLLPLVQDGRFLEGLFYRLNTLTVRATRIYGSWV